MARLPRLPDAGTLCGMALDRYVTLGASGLRVSPFCLGAMTFGEDWGWGSDVATSEAILARYFERGGNFVDTANVYTKGHSEKILGDCLRAGGPGRDRIVIATKFFGNLYPGDPNGGGASRKSLTAACEESLRPPADGLHRSVLDAPVGPVHADRRDDARARRPGARRQGALRRILGHARVEDGPGADARALAGLDAADGAADRVLPARAHGRGRADPDGARAGLGGGALVTAARRRADGKVHRENGRQRPSRPGRAG